MLLEVSELSKKYIRDEKEYLVLDHIDFYVEEGQLISIVGESGSGKSTFFNIITGMLKPTEGSIRIDGVEISGSNHKVADLRNQTIGYILQGQNLLNNFSVIDNICMPFYLTERKGDITGKAEELLNKVGLYHARNSFPSELSGGEAKRAAIVRALINDPAIIIADEPTGNLDPENSFKIIDLFQTIRETGVSVLVSTHDMEFLNYSDRIYKMNKGKLTEITNVIDKTNRAIVHWI